MPEVSAVVPSFNRAEELRACLASLRAMGLAQTVEVIVVDNGSTDGTPDMVRQAFPGVKLLRNDINLGAATAKNQGAAAASGEVLWFLDSDTEIPGPQVVHRGLELLRDDPTAGAVGGEIYEAPGGEREWRQKVLLPNGETRTVSHSGGYGGVLEVDYLPSCNLMMRAEVFRRVGGFDPGYFFLMEDTDLCVRLGALGLRCLASDATAVLHRLVLRDRPGDLYLSHRNRVRFALLNYPAPRAAALPLLDLLHMAHPYKLGALWRGKISAQKHLAPSVRALPGGPLAFPLKLALVGSDYLVSLARAYGWNLAHLPQTLRLRAAGRRDLQAGLIRQDLSRPWRRGSPRVSSASDVLTVDS